MTNILIVETNPKQAREVRRGLSQGGFQCKTFRDAAEALAYAREQEELLMALSTRLPWAMCRGLLELCGQMNWPVLFLAEEDTHADHLRSLKNTRSEVLVCPFETRDMLVAVKRLLLQGVDSLQVGALSMDMIFQTVTYHGQRLSLTPQEFSLLEVLLRSPEEVIDRNTLLCRAWGAEGGYETRTVDVHIQRLRRKLGKDLIETVYKQGYRLVGAML